MRFEIQYRPLLLNFLLINLAMIFLSQVSCGRHHQLSDDDLPAFLLGINACFVLFFIIQPPPRFIQVDKKAGTVTYQMLFRLRKVVLDYSRVWSEFTTRGSRFGPQKVWSLCLDGKELFFVPFIYTGWNEQKLTEIDKLIVDLT